MSTPGSIVAQRAIVYLEEASGLSDNPGSASSLLNVSFTNGKLDTIYFKIPAVWRSL